MGQFAETHFAEFGKVSLHCPFCRIFFLEKWASKFGKVGKESENIMMGISDVCTLALTVAKTSSHYDRFAISGWAEIGRRNGIENQSQSSGRHTKFLNGIETKRIEIFLT